MVIEAGFFIAMADLISITATCEQSISVTATAERTITIVNTEDEYSYYAPRVHYANFEAAARYNPSQFPDYPMDAPLIVIEVTSGEQNFNTYGAWET